MKPRILAVCSAICDELKTHHDQKAVEQFALKAAGIYAVRYQLHDRPAQTKHEKTLKAALASFEGALAHAVALTGKGSYGLIPQRQINDPPGRFRLEMDFVDAAVKAMEPLSRLIHCNKEALAQPRAKQGVSDKDTLTCEAVCEIASLYERYIGVSPKALRSHSREKRAFNRIVGHIVGDIDWRTIQKFLHEKS